MKADRKNLIAGLFLIGLSLFFFLDAAKTLPMGTTFEMGPGYFPIVLSLLLGLFGAITAVRSLGKPTAPFGAVSWRGVILVVAATIAFGVIVPLYGMVPAMIVAVLLSAFSSRQMTIPLALGLAVGLTLFCALLFRYALDLPIPLLGAG